MPNRFTAVTSHAAAYVRSGRDAGRPPQVSSRAHWSIDRATRWRDRTGWLVGCNFIPSTAGNQLEMFQAATFDPETIDRELGWAAGLGMNSVRVFLHDLCWTTDGDAFLDRVDVVAEIADGHGIGLVPVLFDGIWDPRPRPGPQRDPVPGRHNSTWLQSPGADVIADRTRWRALRGYVEAVLGRFGDDRRIQLWDLFNEADQPNMAYAALEPRHKRRLVADLVDEVFDWTTAVDPSQPCTVGVYEFVQRGAEHASPLALVALERSDVVSFHCYGDDRTLTATIRRLERIGRPLVCTEWMARPRSPVAQLAVFRRRGVGNHCWGLVDGRTQTKYPWTSWIRRTPPDAPWFHDLVHPDGTPYDASEAALYRSLTGVAGGDIS